MITICHYLLTYLLYCMGTNIWCLTVMTHLKMRTNYVIKVRKKSDKFQDTQNNMYHQINHILLWLNYGSWWICMRYPPPIGLLHLHAPWQSINCYSASEVIPKCMVKTWINPQQNTGTHNNSWAILYIKAWEVLFQTKSSVLVKPFISLMVYARWKQL